jgi:hypothetical protein
VARSVLQRLLRDHYRKGRCPCFILRHADHCDEKRISLANFTVLNGANKLQRCNGVVGGGVAESGSLKYGTISGTNATNDTATGKYFVSSYQVDTS